MTWRCPELEQFKSRINLTEFAAAHGYALDRKASSHNSAVMVHSAGDKVIVAMDEDGHWVYFSVRDHDDHGSIIDFVQRRLGGTLGHVRQVLRPWLGSGNQSATRPNPSQYAAELAPVARDILSVRARFTAMRGLDPRNSYLTAERRIPSWLLAVPAVTDSIRIDDRGNVCFAHHDDGGLCGYEIKNRSFTGFASGGTKGLWNVIADEPARALVVTETALDGLSYLTIRGSREKRVVSIAGQPNPRQLVLLRAAMTVLPSGGQVVSAMDRDHGGDSLTGLLRAIFTQVARNDLLFVDDRPGTIGNDWNDELRWAVVAGCHPEPPTTP